MSAMLPHLEKLIPFDEFVFGEKNKRAELLKCISAWDKVDRALARNN